MSLERFKSDLAAYKKKFGEDFPRHEYRLQPFHHTILYVSGGENAFSAAAWTAVYYANMENTLAEARSAAKAEADYSGVILSFTANPSHDESGNQLFYSLPTSTDDFPTMEAVPAATISKIEANARERALELPTSIQETLCLALDLSLIHI